MSVNRSSSRSPTREQCTPLPTENGDVCTPAFQIEEQLNEVYERRLAEINEQADGDSTLKEITYKEWIAMLRGINKTLIMNFQDLDRVAAERLSLLQQRASSNCRLSQGSQGNELCKCRKDMEGLMQLVRNGRTTGDWSVDKYKFETITEQDIFGNEPPSCEPFMKYESEYSKQPCSSNDPRNSQNSKLIANVKALAFEVADKHDEIRDLKKQILSMEDEIQKAQKKIQLKDDVIKELRNDLKALPKCATVFGTRFSDLAAPNLCCLQMAEVKSSESCESATPRASDCYSNMDSLNLLNCNPIDSMVFGLNISDDDDEEEEFTKCLKKELIQFFEMRRNHDQNVEEQRRAIADQQIRLSDMVDKLLKNNNDYRNKLRFYRQELLERPLSVKTITLCSDRDSGISSDSDPDVKIVNSVRNLISGLIEENYHLKRAEQCLNSKLQDADSKTLAKSELLDKTSRALREVADALTNATCKPIAYERIFEKCPNMTTNNPIVEAVDDLLEMMSSRDHLIEELQKKITNSGKKNRELESNSQTLQAELSEFKQSV